MVVSEIFTYTNFAEDKYSTFSDFTLKKQYMSDVMTQFHQVISAVLSVCHTFVRSTISTANTCMREIYRNLDAVEVDNGIFKMALTREIRPNFHMEFFRFREMESLHKPF